MTKGKWQLGGWTRAAATGGKGQQWWTGGGDGDCPLLLAALHQQLPHLSTDGIWVSWAFLEGASPVS